MSNIMNSKSFPNSNFVFLRYLLFALLGLAVISMAGCRTAPIQNVSKTQVPSSNAQAKDVKKAIFSAGAGLGWIMKEMSPGFIIGTLNLRGHMAKVEIPYSATSYSIRYKDSSNLQHDPEKGTIHSNYNGWVSRLNNTIMANLSAL